MWQILHSLFTSGSPNCVRALNLQYYYVGHLNYSCHYQEKRGLALKKFDFTKRTSNNYPEFECSLARGGCHGDNDCHYRPVWRACRGETCVRYVKEKQDTGVSKVKATLHIGSWVDMGWYGCEWSVWASYYACYNYDRNVRKVVWYLPSRDVASDRVPLHHSDHHKVNHQGLMKGDGGAEKL